MVDIRRISLKVLLGFALLAAGCAMNPLQTPAGAPVEQPAPTQPPAKQDKDIKPVAPTQGPAPVISPAPAPEPPQYKEEVQEVPEERPAPGKAGSAVVALLDDADQYAATGRHEQAVASLERALRIEPKNPLLWHKLSRLRLDEKNWKQALALAKKSNVLAAGNKTLQAENWKIIAQSLQKLGDEASAAKAWETVRQLEQ